MICGVAALASSQALAQQAAPASQNELVVTGSRIPTPNLTSVSPISVVSSQDFKLEGATDIVDALGELPQVSVGNGLNNTPDPLSSSGGFTTVDLRNLGTVRTLVLEDGKRLMPGDPTVGGEAADIDTIPTALVDRVDLVTGGASAVYGSDAVAGVVNFIMKHNFQGVQLDAQYGADWHDNGNTQMQGLEKAFGAAAPSGSVWDGTTWTASMVVGANAPDGKGNVTAYVGYRHQDPVSMSTRDYSACQLTQASGTPACTGSSNSNLFKDDNTGDVYSVTGADPANIFTTTRNQSTTPPAHFNSNPFEYLSRGDERYQGGFFAHYAASPAADFYSDFAFMDDRTRIDVAPSALFQQTFEVNCNNPFLSAQQVTTICTNNGLGPTQDATLDIGRRDVEGGPRIYTYEHLSYKADIGVRGDVLDDAWHYDVYAQYGRTNYNYGVQNDLSLSKVQNALLVTGTAASPACVSGAPCVPYDIFADGGVTPAALSYILTSGQTTGDTQEQIVSANFTGDLSKYGVKSPWATDGVGVNIGAEYRREQLDLLPDETSLSGDLAGAGGALPPVHGSFSVEDLFGEIRVPLAQDMPLVKDLDFEGGYRFSHYSVQGQTNTYKLALNWSPTSDIRFRGSFQRAVRAPDVQELFAPQTIGNSPIGFADPCAPDAAGPGAPATASLAQCQNTAGRLISASQIAALYGDGRSPTVGGTDKISQCPAFQCGDVIGGNLSLTPEVSTTYSIGAVFTPQWVRGFNFSVDYFNITIDNAISTFPINIALTDCVEDGTHCDSVVRKANGSLFGSNIPQGGYISGTNLNINTLKTSGFDFSANYRFDLDQLHLANAGHLAISFNGSWTQHLIFILPNQGQYDCAGLYGFTCVAPTPKWRHIARLTWISPWKLTLSGQWRFMGATALDANQSNPAFGGPFGDVLDGHIPAYSYFDLSGTYAIRDGLLLRAGVNNVFDKDPPVLDSGVTGSGSPNSFPNFDLLGRVVFIGLTANF